MGIYGKASELVDSLQAALERGEPVVDLAPQLMQTGLELMRQGSQLMERTTETLERLDALGAGAEALLKQARVNAELEQRRLQLAIRQLERG